jgi:hypothetical protein
LVVAGFDASEDHLGRVDDPAPGGPDGVCAVAPTKDAFVGTGKRGCSFHALVGRDAVEGIFVAGSSAAECGFGPAADFHARVRAYYGVALFGECSVSG